MLFTGFGIGMWTSLGNYISATLPDPESYKKIFIYLPVQSLSYGMQDL